MVFSRFAFSSLICFFFASSAASATFVLRAQIASYTAPRVSPDEDSQAGFDLGGSGSAYLIHLESYSPSLTRGPASITTSPLPPAVARSGERVPLALKSYASGQTVRIVLTSP